MASDTVNKDWGTKVDLVAKIEQIFCHYFCKLLLFSFQELWEGVCVCVYTGACLFLHMLLFGFSSLFLTNYELGVVHL